MKVNKDYSDTNGRYFWILLEDKSVPIIFDIKSKKIYDWMIINLSSDKPYNTNINDNMLIDRYIDNSGVVIGICDLNVFRNRNELKKTIDETDILNSIEKVVIDSLS